MRFVQVLLSTLHFVPFPSNKTFLAVCRNLCTAIGEGHNTRLVEIILLGKILQRTERFWRCAALLDFCSPILGVNHIIIMSGILDRSSPLQSVNTFFFSVVRRPRPTYQFHIFLFLPTAHSRTRRTLRFEVARIQSSCWSCLLLLVQLRTPHTGDTRMAKPDGSYTERTGIFNTPFVIPFLADAVTQS